MIRPTAERKTIEVLAEDFVARYRGGERPALVEYIGAHPELADEIRELFPTLVIIEELAPSNSGSSVPPTAASSEQPHLSLGDYRLIREVGRGGMGVVYEAEQVSLGRRVALKVLPRHVVGDAALRQRFHREARAAAQLHHTNIVPVFEVGEDRDTCWYAMQLILGQGLDQIIEELRQQPPSRSQGRQPSESPVPPTGQARGSLSQLTHAFVSGQYACLEPDAAMTPSTPVEASPRQASADTIDSTRLGSRTELSAVDSEDGQYYRSVARIGRQVAEALAHAHARGIIHRDVKPSNLLLDMAGIVWITDFGLAKTGNNSLTTTGDIVGTLRYMAPERFKGECDERTDVYGLGLTLYELLVLRPAFEEHDRLQLIDKIKNQEPARPRALDSRIPSNLETIVLKAIHKEAKQRYTSAQTLAEDLRRFLENEPIQARRTSELERLRMWGRRNPALAILSASLLVLLAVVAAAATTAALYLQATLDVSEKRRESAEKAKLDGKRELWRSYLTQAQARRMSRQPGQRIASLRAIKAALDLPVPPGRSRDELRTEAIAALCLPDLELAHEGGSEIVGAKGFTIDAAFQRYAIADKDGKVSIRRLSDDEELLQLPGGGLVNEYEGLKFSPDGRFLHQRCQVQEGYRSRLWDLEAPQPKPVLDDEHCNLAFRPDSRQCAASYPDKTVRFFDIASGGELRRFRVAAMTPDCGLYWNPKLTQLLISTPSSFWLLNVDTGAIAAVGPKVPGGYMWVTWHPEGRLLAVCGNDLKIHLWDVPNGRQFLPPLEDHKHGGLVAKFNHAGDRLLSTDWSGSWHLWDTRSGRLLLTYPAGGTMLHFSPDDRLVGGGGSGKVQLYHFRRGEELCTVVHRKAAGNYHGPGSCIDPEGRLCALGMRWHAEGVALVDVARGEEAALLPLPGNVPLRFDREGALWTSGSAGLLRWPMAANPKTEQHRYGPPERILPTFSAMFNVGLGAGADLRVVAIPNGSAGVFVIHRDSNRLARLGPQEDVRSCAVSPDGRWVATGSHWLHEGVGAKVWDIRAEKHVKDLPVGGCCGVRFSPDGKWLLTTSGGCRLWSVGSWEEGPSVGRTSLNPSGAFSCDGKLLALGNQPSVVRLVMTDTGAEIAQLTVPEQSRLVPCCFTADGTKLLAVGTETGALYVFDLAAIRAGLAELDLDWDGPPLPAASAPPALPLSIHFDLGYLRQWAEADALVRQAAQHIGDKEHAKALAELRKAVNIAPNHAVAHNNLAWLLLTGPKELRDPAQALLEARKAVELAPNPHWLNTLGVALYYTGHFAEAIPVLERSLGEGKGQTDAFDLFFLAMCHHRLGDAAKAKDYHERGKQWFGKHRGQLHASWVAELTVFQAEADAVLAQPPGQAKK
jgi:serine/threonine protein kinase/WD40 repeat protein